MNKKEFKRAFDKWYNSNYTKLEKYARSAAYKASDASLYSDLLADFYIDTVDNWLKYRKYDFEVLSYNFFQRTYYKQHPIHKYSNRNETSKNFDLVVEYVEDKKEPDIIEEMLVSLENKVDKLDPVYKEVYRLVFIEKNITIQLLANAMETNIYSAWRIRNKLITKLGGDPKEFSSKYLK